MDMLRIVGAVLLVLGGMARVQAQIPTRLIGTLDTCSQDSLLIFDLEIDQLRPLAAIPLALTPSGHQFSVQLGNIQPGFYLIGNGSQAGTIPVLLGPDSMVAFSGSCDTLSKASVQNPAGTSYRRLMQQRNALSSQFQTLIQQLRRSQRDSLKKAQALADLAALDQQQRGLLAQARAEAPILEAVIGLQTYLSFQHNGPPGLGESRYLLRHFFAQSPLESSVYERVPDLRARFQQFGTNVGQLGLPHDTLVAGISAILDRMPPASRRYRMALRGLIDGLEGRNVDLFAEMAGRYVRQYGGTDPVQAQRLQKALAALEGRLLGQVAKDIAIPGVEGDTLRISDFRGQYLLVDFWAAWCGPCRAENPRLRAAYARFHAAGFEILGISLDNTKKRWLEAIGKDKLTWPQCSELKGWRGQASQAFGIHSIPASLLLDPQGRIIAKNLRGSALEAKLKSLLELGR